MSDYVAVAGKTGDKYLAALAASQEGYLKYAAAWSRWLPKSPAPQTNSLPWIAFTNAWFAFSEKLIAQQTQYAEKFLGGTMPSAAGPSKPVATKKASTTSAKRTSANRAKAKKTKAKPATQLKTTATRKSTGPRN